MSRLQRCCAGQTHSWPAQAPVVLVSSMWCSVQRRAPHLRRSLTPHICTSQGQQEPGHQACCGCACRSMHVHSCLCAHTCKTRAGIHTQTQHTHTTHTTQRTRTHNTHHSMHTRAYHITQRTGKHTNTRTRTRAANPTHLVERAEG